MHTFTYWSLIPRALGVNSILMLSQLSLAAAYVYLETFITVSTLIKYVPLFPSVCHPAETIPCQNLIKLPIISQVLKLLLSPGTEGRPPEMGMQSTLFPLSS
jgi:hypothetical protein